MKDIQATVLVDLKPDEEGILNSLTRGARKGIKKAIRSGLVLEEVKNDKDWEEFYKIFQKRVKEEGRDLPSLTTLKDNNLVFLVCKKNSKIIAGAGISLGKTIIPGRQRQDIYNLEIPRLYFNDSIKEYLKLNPNNFLYWNCILWCKGNGFKEFDLGGWQINAKTPKLVGVNKFKERWGKIIYYKRDYPFYIAIGRKLVRKYNLIWRLNKWKKRKLNKFQKLKLINDENKRQNNIKSFESENALAYYDKAIGITEIENELIEKYFKGTILDLGCGCGRITSYLFNKEHNVVGVDISKNLIKKAKIKFPKIKFKVNDACKLKFIDDSFDIVFFSFNGLDCIFPERKRIKALKEIGRVLKPGGLFIFNSHNPKALLLNFRPYFFFRNLVKRSLFSRYKFEKTIFGEFYLYYASSKKQKELINKNTNLIFIEKVSKGIRDLHPHYIFQKQK